MSWAHVKQLHVDCLLGQPASSLLQPGMRHAHTDWRMMHGRTSASYEAEAPTHMSTLAPVSAMTGGTWRLTRACT